MNAEKWERIARVLKAENIGDREIAARLGTTAQSVRKVRADLGLPIFRHRYKEWTPEEFERAAPRIQGGHRLWKGRRGPSGVPMANRLLTAYQLAFRLHHGRDPVGKIVGRCRRKGCVEGAHLVDRVMRDAVEDTSTLTELPAEATFQGMDIVAIRQCLRGDPPWPPLDLDEARFAFRFADPRMPSTELARRIGLCSATVDRYRNKGVPS
ncbi:hypothetical protein ACWDBO_37395 [Streptomyces mirabilis]|uniref:hypothetical protein n=1 Tax=Streptomyces mirabilis TaxID=68239 RepID=UPI00332482E4